MILVDTSVWVSFFRGHEPLAAKVDEGLLANEVALCGPVEAELRRGLANARERKAVLPLLEACHWLTQPESLWSEAGDLGFFLRRRGFTAKTLDLLIAVYSLSHSVALLTADRDFVAMKRAGVPIQLV